MAFFRKRKDQPVKLQPVLRFPSFQALVDFDTLGYVGRRTAASVICLYWDNSVIDWYHVIEGQSRFLAKRTIFLPTAYRSALILQELVGKCVVNVNHERLLRCICAGGTSLEFPENFRPGQLVNETIQLLGKEVYHRIMRSPLPNDLAAKHEWHLQHMRQHGDTYRFEEDLGSERRITY